MNVLKYVTILIAVVTLNACRSDEFSEVPGTNTIPTDIPVSITGNLDGLIVDENQQAIKGALVEFGGLSTITDENGVFSFDNAVALSTGSLVKINKDGYYDGFKFTTFEPGENSILKVQMVSKKVIASFQNSEEATIDVNGAELYFPSNIITRSDGTPYEGVVEVKAHWYDPTKESTITEMPGDLRGENVEGVAVQLITYGMMAVEITSDSGEELKLKEGMKATISLPIPSDAIGPEQIPMSHLDEETGVWIEEGVAINTNSSMVAEVSHFSFWSCNTPYPVVNIRGRVVSYPGDHPVSGLQIIITDNNQMLSGDDFTNNQGVFSGRVPLGNDLSMNVFHCGELIEFKSLGVLNEDIDFGDITIGIEDQLNLEATLLDCEGVPLENGVALVKTDNSLDLVVANEGEIHHTAFPCTIGEGTLQAYNSDYTIGSDELSFSLEESVVDLGEIVVCDSDPDQKITYSFQGGAPVTFTNAIVSIVDDTYLHIYAEEEGSSPLNFIQLRYYLDGVPQSMGFQNQIYIGGELNNTSANDYTIADPTGTWNNVTGLNVGDAVYGVLEDHPIINITVAYNLTIDQIITTASVTGNIWVDSDEDGIRESNETETPTDIRVLARADEPGFRSYYHYFEMASDGSYVLRGLAENKEYYLSAVTPTGEDPVLTSYQQGTDPTIDNDFKESNTIFGNRSASFILDAEEVLPNMGLGYINQ